MNINLEKLDTLSIADLLAIIHDQALSASIVSANIRGMGEDYDAIEEYGQIHKYQLIKTFCQDEYNKRLKLIFSFD